jgi:hypothetical protein
MSLCSERGDLSEAPKHGIVGLVARCMNEVSEIGITSWINGGQAQSVDVVADETLASKVVCAIDCLPAGLIKDKSVSCIPLPKPKLEKLASQLKSHRCSGTQYGSSRLIMMLVSVVVWVF